MSEAQKERSRQLLEINGQIDQAQQAASGEWREILRLTQVGSLERLCSLTEADTDYESKIRAAVDRLMALSRQARELVRRRRELA